MENIYQKVDYIVENMSSAELANYLHKNYPEYASYLEYVIGVNFQADAILTKEKEEEWTAIKNL